MTLTIAENFRGLFYSPFYVLRELSLTQRHGLDVHWLPPGSPGGAIDNVKAGKIDLTWGGPMRVMIDHDTSPDDERRLLSLSQAVGRDPFCLIANQANLSLGDLPSLKLAVIKEVPTPWLCLQADLDDIGIAAPAQVLTTLSMQEQFTALNQGSVDVIQAFEPYVSQALGTGAAHLVYEASQRGPTVYTGFIASRATLAARHEEIRALDTALGQALTWMHDAGANETARLIKSYFPDVQSTDLARGASRYLTREVWPTTTTISQAGFHRLSESFFRGGAIRAPAIYEHCVLNFGDE